MSENKEFLEAVAETAEKDQRDEAANFDISDWLTPVTQKDHRKTDEVTLIRDFSLETEIFELNALERKVRSQQQAGVVDPDASVADASPTTDLEERKAELQEKIRQASVVVTVRAMVQPEIDKALGGLRPGHEMYWPRLFAQSVEFPGGQKITASNWPQFRNTIGEGQFNTLVETFNRVSFYTPVKVNASF